MEKAIEYLATVGINQIAIVHVNDSFGKDDLEEFNRKMQELKLKPAATVVYERVTIEMIKPAEEIIKANP